MDKNHLDEDFALIGNLYETYKKALLNKENNASVIESTKQKIVGEFWNLTQKVKTFTPDMKDNSVLIVKTIIACLKTYPDKEPEEFCKLTFASIKRKLTDAASTSSFEDKTGMHITDSEDRKRRKIEKAYKQYISINKADKYAFMRYAEEYLGFNKEDLEAYLFPVVVSSLFIQNKSDKEYCLGDDESAKFVTDASKGEGLDINDFEAKMSIIDSAWLKQKDEKRVVLSDAMTVDLLNDFAKSGADKNFLEVFKKFKFINKEILDSFFSDIDYKLPTQTEVGEKYGLSKSGVSVKVTRFLKSIKQ